MNIGNLLKSAVEKLRTTQYGKLEAEVILASILNKERVYLHININEELEQSIIEKFNKSLDELLNNKPLQYITGKEEWMGYEFLVDENVLIPREDTRILLEQILSLKDKLKNSIKDKKTAPNIVEIGTGSGILPVLVKKNWPEANIFVTEISKATLGIARENFKKHNVDIESFNCDFLEDIKKNKIKTDIIFSNPPYISEEEFKTLDPAVKKEPYQALVGGFDGLLYYRRLAEEFKDVVEKQAYILIEIGWEQYAAVREIFEKKGLNFIGVYKDDGNRNRVLVMEYIEDGN